MKGWLDNYNDSKVTIPPNFVGMGNDISHREYSPAWGGQFEDGGNLNPKDFTLKYIESPKYKSRLNQSGYSNPTGEAKKQPNWLDKYIPKTFLQSDDNRLPSTPRVPYRDLNSSEVAISIGGENGEPAYLIPSFKYEKFLDNPLDEYRKTGEHLGGPFKTWKEADKWEREIRHPYVEKGQPIPSPLKYWGEGFENGGELNYNDSSVQIPPDFVGMGNDTTGRNYSPVWNGQFANGGNIPGSVGFTYARTKGIPSEGKYAKKTLPSALNGTEMNYYREGLDYLPKSMADGGNMYNPALMGIPEGEVPKIIQDFNQYRESPEGKDYFKMMHDNQRAKNISGRIDYSEIDPFTDVLLPMGLFKMKNALNPKWYDQYLSKGFKNEFPSGSIPGNIIERGVAKEEAIQDLISTGVVRTHPESKYKGRVFWGEEGGSGLPRNNFTIIAKQPKKGPVTKDDVRDILVKDKDIKSGETIFNTYPGFKKKNVETKEFTTKILPKNTSVPITTPSKITEDLLQPINLNEASERIRTEMLRKSKTDPYIKKYLNDKSFLGIGKQKELNKLVTAPNPKVVKEIGTSEELMKNPDLEDILGRSGFGKDIKINQEALNLFENPERASREVIGHELHHSLHPSTDKAIYSSMRNTIPVDENIFKNSSFAPYKDYLGQTPEILARVSEVKNRFGFKVRPDGSILDNAGYDKLTPEHFKFIANNPELFDYIQGGVPKAMEIARKNIKHINRHATGVIGAGVLVNQEYKNGGQLKQLDQLTNFTNFGEPKQWLEKYNR